MIAGPNRSGKTTLIEEMRQRGIDLGEHISPDEIAEGLEGSYATNGSGNICSARLGSD
jgi:predicted ABC-type ATPase